MKNKPLVFRNFSEYKAKYFPAKTDLSKRNDLRNFGAILAKNSFKKHAALFAESK